MQLDELERLYNEQAYTEAITKLEIYLQDYPKEARGWHLLGLSQLENARATDNADLVSAMYEAAYDAFTQVLTIDTTHAQARLHRAYLGANIMTEKGDEAISDCDVLIAGGDEDITTKALLYRFQIWVLKEETEKALADMQRSLQIYESLYADDLPQLSVARFQCYTRIGDVYYHTENRPAALEYYKQAFDCTVYNNRLMSTVWFALEMADYDFAANMLQILISTGENSREEMLRLLKHIQQLLTEGVRHAMLAREYCKGTTEFWHEFYGEDDDEGTLEQILAGKNFVSQYPDEAYFYHYTATAFFNIGSYQEAFPWYEKSMAIKPYPFSIVRWYYTTYKVTGHFPATWPDIDHPIPYDWYAAGVIFTEIIQLENDPLLKQAATPLKRFLYKKAFDLYHAYWYENKGNSYAGHPHHFAMCCNNYGIALYEAGIFVEAAHVHTIGYNMSPFWEQLESRADAYHNMGKLAEAIADRRNILENHTDVLPLMYYVSIHERMIDDLCTLERHAEALDLYEKILSEYNEWIVRDMEELEVYDRDTITYNIDRIKTGRAFIRSNSDNDLSERILALESHLTDKPDDSDAYFNLMYLYFDNGQYEHCIGAINNRISIGGIPQLPVISQMKIYYFRGKAALKLKRYKAAIADMQQTLEIMASGDAADNSPNYRFGVYAFMAEAYLGEQEYDQCLSYGIQCVNIYAGNNWAWDAEASAIRYTMALAFEAKEDLSSCKKLIDLIVANDPGYQPAVEKKKQLKGGGLFSFFRKKK
ncbi:hypothetical protein HGH93_28405 [Chitinophaga polysaccharea]|uniref:hypothetical protein n=1 Tax=Chitinophaga polysaccharea TaxID=1293035 RepID=UPI0014556DAD|nr:hypothetical protein [Chitinophaga polysaccharea]NLR62049.1 hypothetical protein [Chitinophaga polysaccharea]